MLRFPYGDEFYEAKPSKRRGVPFKRVVKGVIAI